MVRSSSVSTSRRRVASLWLRFVIAVCAIVAVSPHITQAQSLRAKRTLTVGVAPGCENVVARPANARRDIAEARRLSAAGQEAALTGDQKTARDAFAKAADLNPVDDRIAYDLGRAHEELVDSTSAIREYCRYLTLSPAGPEAGDVRVRLQQLVPKAAAQNAQDLLAKFRLGLFLYDSARYDAAERAFDEVVQKAPLAYEGYFNRALMRAAVGSRAEALKDFESYLAAVPTADDRAEVTRTITVLCGRSTARDQRSFAASFRALVSSTLDVRCAACWSWRELPPPRVWPFCKQPRRNKWPTSIPTESPRPTRRNSPSENISFPV